MRVANSLASSSSSLPFKISFSHFCLLACKVTQKLLEQTMGHFQHWGRVLGLASLLHCTQPGAG